MMISDQETPTINFFARLLHGDFANSLVAPLEASMDFNWHKWAAPIGANKGLKKLMDYFEYIQPQQQSALGKQTRESSSFLGPTTCRPLPFAQFYLKKNKHICPLI